VVVAVATLGS